MNKLVMHRCGHSERINVDGQYTVIARRVEAIERTDCVQCAAARLTPKREELGFCKLWGSREQCARAEFIRRRTLSQAIVYLRHADARNRPGFEELCRWIRRYDNAEWWCEHKDDAIQVLAQEIEL